MASKVKLIKSDIPSQSGLKFVTDIVKHSLSLAIIDPVYKAQLEARTDRKDLADLMKLNKFRKLLISHIY